MRNYYLVLLVMRETWKGAIIVFRKTILAQIKLLLRQKEAIITFYILLLLCLINYVGNVLEFQGYDLIEMYHPMKLLLLSYNRIYYSADATLFFVQLYPLLVVCPAGFSLVKEQQTKQESLIVARTSLATYRFSKIIACFIVTSIVFVLPFLIEMFLNCIAFPFGANGDLSNMGYYSMEYIESVHNYFLCTLFIKAPYLYTFLCIILFGMITGLLSTVVLVITSIVKIKYKVLLFVPIYVLLNVTLYLENIFPGLRTNWYNYLLIFHDENKNYNFYFIGLLVCVIFIIGGTIYSCKKESF